MAFIKRVTLTFSCAICYMVLFLQTNFLSSYLFLSLWIDFYSWSQC